MAIITIKDKDGNLIDIPAIKGDKGDSVDVQINGTSITQDGVANIPLLDGTNTGLVRLYEPDNNSGHLIVTQAGPRKGCLSLNMATQNYIDKRWGHPIGASEIDYAVKSALCDGQGQEYTQEEKTAARDRLGLEWKHIDTIEVSDVEQLDITFPQEYNEFIIVADVSGNGSLVIHPYSMYNINNGIVQSRQMLHSAYYPGDKDEHLELTFEKINVGDDIYFRISGFEKTDYAWNLNKNIQTTGWIQMFDIANTKQCFAWHYVKLQRTITNATFKIYAR